MAFWSHLTGLATTRSKLAESALWKAQAEFYQYHGVASWDNKVPYQISNSVYLACVYVDLCIGYLQDLRQQGYHHKLVLLELGTAHGKFIFHVLQRLESLLPSHGFDLENDVAIYCCDCSDKMLTFWNTHPQLSDYVERGVLQMHLFHIDYHSGIQCDINFASWEDKHVVLMANYFFDSLYQNAFSCKNNRVYALDVILPDPLQETCGVEQIDFIVDETSTAHTFYDHAIRNGILVEHIGFNCSQFLMPDAAMDIIDFFNTRCKQILLLTSDKGFSGFNNLQYCEKLSLCYEGSVASSVNFFALGRYVTLAHQGSCLLASENLPGDQVFFATQVFLTQGDLNHLPRLMHTARQHLEESSVADHYIHQLMWKSSTLDSLQAIQAFIRSNYYDPFFAEPTLRMLERSMKNGAIFRSTWLNSYVERMSQQCYFIPSEIAEKSFFNCARLAIRLHNFSLAQSLIARHQDLYGKNYYHFFLSGELCVHQEKFTRARNHLACAEKLQPECSETKRYIELCCETYHNET